MVEVADIAPPPVITDRGEGFGDDPAYFCDDCPFKGDADGVITGAMVWTYRVGINRTGAAGALKDADGNYSKPVDLPFKGRERAYLEAPEKTVYGPSEYWTDLPVALKVDEEGRVEAIGKCEGPEISKTRILRREVKRCPALIAHMMARSTRKEIENTTADLVTEERG